jgi:hypothetical protein
MNKRRLIGGFLCLAILGGSTAVSAGDTPPPHKPDLADAVQGSYFGDVISDSQGSGRSGVSITVTRVGKNLVQVTSDYPRLPEVTVKVERAMDKILQVTGDTTFLYDPDKSPPHLDVSFHNEVSWSGERR